MAGKAQSAREVDLGRGPINQVGLVVWISADL